jgi:ribosomal protein L7/L12
VAPKQKQSPEQLRQKLADSVAQLNAAMAALVAAVAGESHASILEVPSGIYMDYQSRSTTELKPISGFKAQVIKRLKTHTHLTLKRKCY